MLPSGHPERLPEGLNILGAIFLARLLTPAEFGIYAIIVFIRGFLTAFSDAGLAASLIRQPVEPDEEDYRAIFTFQQMMVLGVAVPFWLACPLVAHLYKLPVHDAWVFRLVDLSLLCSSFQVIPSTKLERDLAFHKIAVIEISMALVFNGVSVFLAYQGWGEMSFAWGLFLRSIIGAGLANAIRPWRIGWRWDWKRIREHMRFGIPYQGIAFISLMKDSIGPTLIAIFLGAAEMGYVNWAIMITYYPFWSWRCCSGCICRPLLVSRETRNLYPVRWRKFFLRRTALLHPQHWRHSCLSGPLRASSSGRNGSWQFRCFMYFGPVTCLQRPRLLCSPF